METNKKQNNKSPQQLSEGRDYKAYIEKLGPDAVKKITQYHNTEDSLKIDKENKIAEKKLKEVEAKIKTLLNKGRQKWNDSEFNQFLTLTQTKVRLEEEIKTDLALIKQIQFDVKDINGKKITITMTPTLIKSDKTKFNNHTLYKFQLPENCSIYMRKSTSIDFLKTIEL